MPKKKKIDVQSLLTGGKAHTAQEPYPHGTQALVPIERIKDGIICTKDGRYAKILEVLPVNFHLKSPLEQETTLFITHLQNGGYANIDMLFQNFRSDCRALADAKDVYRAVDRCMASVQDNTNYSVNIVLAQDGIIVSISTCYGTVKNKVPVSEVLPSAKEGFHYNPDKLIAFLRNASGPLELLIDRQGCMLLKANNSSYFIGPRRPAGIRRKKQEKAPASQSKSKKSAGEQLKIAA